MVFVLAAWFVSGDARRIRPRGPDTVPRSEELWAAVLQVAMPLAAIAILAVVIRRRRRRVPGSGFEVMFVAAFASLYWLDPSVSYAEPLVLFNSTAVNLGSWTEHIPGWANPTGSELPEPLLIVGPAYLLNLAIEIIFISTGLLAWAGTIPGLTVNAGQPKQYPLYEPLVFGGVVWVAMAALHHFRDDRGRTVVERGIDRVEVAPGGRRVLRFLAVVGFAHLVMAVSCIAVGLSALHVGPYPEYPSYLRNGVETPE